jgi:hypothetical protein
MWCWCLWRFGHKSSLAGISTDSRARYSMEVITNLLFITKAKLHELEAA